MTSAGRRAGRAAGGVVAASGLAVAYAVGIERRWYATRHEVLDVLRRPGRLRVMVFADLHLAPGQGHRLAYLRRAAEEWQPDVIVSAGDNLESGEVIDDVVALHRDVLASTGAVGLAVLGAHDRYGPTRGNPATYLLGPSSGPRGQRLDTDRLVEGLSAGGWQVLENAGTVVDTPAGAVQVVGVGDPHIDADDLGVVPAADPGAVLRLGLVHAPYLRALHAFDASGFDLALSGHTHGGQLAVPWWGALVSNCDLPPSQARGTSRIGVDLRLHVSAGLGHSIYFPFRFACRPELSVLDLVGAPGV
ncbi:metallophosphoesterase [Euzebya sp.]|uniref:metallophosphoesterase n=1 Tax=Euzebya sp. TaxID=1971409 RepID=UPI003514482B